MSSERQKDTAIEALVDASVALHGIVLEESETNVLSALGNLVSKTVRRAVLLRELQANEWHLKNVAIVLRMGKDATTVVRAIRELGLESEYEKAKKELGILPGGHRAVGAKEGVR